MPAEDLTLTTPPGDLASADLATPSDRTKYELPAFKMDLAGEAPKVAPIWGPEVYSNIEQQFGQWFPQTALPEPKPPSLADNVYYTPFDEPTDPVHAKDEIFANDKLSQLFLDDEHRKLIYSSSNVRDFLSTSMDPDLDIKRSVNWDWLEWKTGNHFDTREQYDAARNAYSLEHDTKPVRSDKEFFELRRKDFEKEALLKTTFQALEKKAAAQFAVDYATGNPSALTPLIDELANSDPAFKKDPELQARAVLGLRQVAGAMHAAIQDVLPDVTKAVPIVQALQTDEGNTDANWKAFADILRGGAKTPADLDTNRIDKIISFAVMAAQAVDPEGKNREGMTGMARNLRDALFREGFSFVPQGSNQMLRGLIEEKRQQLKDGDAMLTQDGKIFLKTPGYEAPEDMNLRPPTKDEVADINRKLDDATMALWMENKIRDAMASSIDPTKPTLPGVWGTIEDKVVYGFLKMAPISILGGVLPRPVGYLLMGGATYSQEFNQLDVNNPGMPYDVKRRLAYESAAWQAPLDAIQTEAIFKHFPIKAKLVMQDLHGGRFLAAAGKMGVSYAAEVGIEGLQNQISNTYQAFGNLIAEGKLDSGEAWSLASQRAWKQTWEQMPDTALAMLPLTLVGGGITAWNERGLRHEDLLAGFTPSGLAKQGLSPEAIDRVLSKPDLGSMAAQLVIEYPGRTPEAMAKANAMTVEEKSVIHRQMDEVMQSQETGQIPRWEQRPLDSGEIEYTISDPTGKVIKVTTNRTIAEQAYVDAYEAATAANLTQADTQQQAEETARKTAEAQAELHILDAEGKEVAVTSPAASIDFDKPGTAPAAPDAALTSLQAQIAKKSPGLTIRELTPSQVQTTTVGSKVMAAVKLLQEWGGRKVRFIEHAGGGELFFNGVVDPAHPDTIWIDARGNRSTLAIFGHEFTESLKIKNPTLYSEFVEAVMPYVDDIEAERERIAKQYGNKYTPEERTKEYMANVVGDALSHPDLLAKLSNKNPTFFAKLISALKEWFGAFKEFAASTFGTEHGIVVDQVHNEVIKLLERVKTSTPEPVQAMAPDASSEPLTFALKPAPSMSKPEFKEWFKNSVVVDEFGRPMVVYHGTTKNFTLFRYTSDLGFHFGTAQAANDRLAVRYTWSPEGLHPPVGANIMPVYLSIQNPVRLPDLGDWDPPELIKVLEKVGALEDYQARNAMNYIHRGREAWKAPILEALKENGFDGIIYRNVGEGKRYGTPDEINNALVKVYPQFGLHMAMPAHDFGANMFVQHTDPTEAVRLLRDKLAERELAWDDSFIVFDPEQAKSAMGNVGTWGQVDMGGKEKDLLYSLKEDPEANDDFEMEIKRGIRETAAIGYITPEERIAMDGHLEKFLDKNKDVPDYGPRRDAIKAQLWDQLENDIRTTRRLNPDKAEPKTESTTGVTSPWASITPSGIVAVFNPTGGKGGKGVVKATAKWKDIPYSFDKLPEGVTREQHASNLAKIIVNEFLTRVGKDDKNARTILAQVGWYRDLIIKLRREYGGFSDMFADFLGAFSPINMVPQNWKDAVEFLQQVTLGKYDALFEELHAWVESGKSIKQWRDADKPIPLKENDLTLFGANTDNGLNAVLEMWRETKKGDSPKARNFTKNLIALSIKATIDRWAARTLQRVADRPRIPIGSGETGVAGLHTSATEVGGQFGFGQEVFRLATEMITAHDPVRYAGLLPSDMQAMNWYLEKEIWGTNNWTTKLGEGGSFNQQLKVQNPQRFVIGLSQAVGTDFPPHAPFIPDTPQNVAFGKAVRADLVAAMKKVGQYLIVRAKDTIGMYERGIERSLDTELITGNNIEPMDMVRVAAKHAGQKHQKTTFVARVIKSNEPDNPNARPGMEVYFSRQVTAEELKPVMEYLIAKNIDGFTMMVDARSRPNPIPGGSPDKFWGIRFMFVPEYAGYEPGQDWSADAESIEDALDDSIAEVQKIKGVAHVITMRYDAVVLKIGTDYDESGILESSPGKDRAEAWRERFLRATSPSTASVDGPIRGRPGGAKRVSHRKPSGTAERGPPGSGGDAGPSFSLKPGKFAQAKEEGVDRTASVHAIFEQIHGQPQRKAALTARAYRLWEKVRNRHEAEQAAYQPPEVPDEKAALTELNAHEQLAGEDLSAEEQAALDQSSLNVGDRYGDRIQAEQDIVKRRALEREQRVYAASQRAGIEAVYTERRKALAHDYAMQRQALRTKVAQAQLASTAEGTAATKRARRIQTFAELNSILGAMPEDVRAKIPPTPSLESLGEQGLVDFLTKRLAKIGAVIEENLTKDFLASIDNLLERAKPKKSKQGVLKGRIGDADHFVALVDEVKNFSHDKVALETNTIELQLTTGDLTPEQEAELLQKQQILTLFGDLKNQDAASLEAAHIALQERLRQGRSQWATQEQARIDKQNAQADELVASLGGKASPGEVQQVKREEGVLATAGGFIHNHYSLLQLLKQVLPQGLSFVDNWIDRARRADSQTEDITRASSDRFTAVVRAASGRADSLLRAGNVIKELQTPVVRGRDRQLMSKMEAIQYLLSWEQSKVRERMVKNEWKDEDIERLRVAVRDPVSQAVMAFLRDEYAKNWAMLNPIYRSMYGVDMPRIPNYAPTRYHFTGAERDLNLFGGPTATSGMTPTFAHARVNHSYDLRQQDAMYVYMQHMAQSASFVSYSQLIREMRGTLNRADVKMTLEARLGSANYDALNRWVEALQRNGSNRAAETLAVEKFIRTLTAGKAISTMILNVRTLVMQTDSAFRFMAEIPAKAWARTFLDPNFLSNIPKAWHSDTIQRRVMEGMSQEMQYVMRRNNITPTVFTEAIRLGFLPMRAVDGAFTSFSSAAVFTYHYNEMIKAGMAPSEAEAYAADKMDAAVHRFSQPVSLTAKPGLATNSPALFKMILMFMSDPMLKSAMVMEATENIVKGRGTAMDVQRIGAVMAWGMLSQLVANLYRAWATDDTKDIFDPWEFLRAALFAPFNGIFLVGEFVEATLAWTTGAPMPRHQDPMLQSAFTAKRAYDHFGDFFSRDPNLIIKEADNILKTMGALDPTQVSAALNILTNVMKPIMGVTTKVQKKLREEK